MAAPGKPAESGKKEYMQLRMVDVHNGFLNVHPNAKHRDIKVKALVRDTVAASNPTSVSVVLAHYEAKGKPAVPAAIADQPVSLQLKSKAGKKSQMYRGVADGDALAALLAPVVKPGTTTFICLKSATLDGAMGIAPAKQVAKKIERGRDCFRVVNVDPDLTKGESDDS
jgi:hypothetical protein